MNKRIFEIDYYHLLEYKTVKTLLIQSDSRSEAEDKCRKLEYPNRINIKTIKYHWKD